MIIYVYIYIISDTIRTLKILRLEVNKIAYTGDTQEHVCP